MEDKKVLAIFDFDGTITAKDTLFDFIKFYVGKQRLYMGILILSPILISFKLGIINNEKAKQILFSYFFKGKRASNFDAICQQYAEYLPKILNQEAFGKIEWHQQQGHLVIIDSASIENWIAPWAKAMAINDVIGTKMEVMDGIITGQFDGKNCHGIEKVNRLVKRYPDYRSYTIYAYGDSNGDKELLSIADYPFYRKF